MQRRLIWYTVWILGALLVMASVDATPDPPALNPHMSGMKVRGHGECAKDPCGTSETGNFPDLFARLHLEEGQTANPSPPVMTPPVLVLRS